MAVASDWLKRKAQEQKENKEKAGSDLLPATGNDTQEGTYTGKASAWLQRKAREQAAQIDERDGADAYGGSNWLKQQLEELNREPVQESFYSRPELGAETESLYNKAMKLKPGFEKKRTALESAQSSLKEAESGLTFWQNQVKLLQENYQTAPSQQSADLYNRAYSQYESASTAYSKAYDTYKAAFDTYKPTEDAFNAAAKAYTDYVTSQQKLYDSWKSTIRDGGAVQAELKAVEEEIKALETREWEERNARQQAAEDAKPWYEKLAGYLGGVQDTTLPTASLAVGTPNSAGTVSPEMQALLDRQALLQEEAEWSEYFKWADFAEMEDFEEKSKYISTANGHEEKNYLTGGWSNTGYDDINYDYINRNEDARLKGWTNDTVGDLTWSGNDRSYLAEMTDDEIKIFNYIYATQSPETAYEYANYLTTSLNERQRMAAEEKAAQYAKEHPVLSSIGTVFTSPLKAISYAGQIADYAQDGKIDENAGYNKYSYINSAVRGAVTEKVEDKWGKVGSFAYQTGMSMADFLLNTAITGGNSTASLAIMGTGAAADTTIAAKDRGLSDGQAFALGTVAGIAEAAAEKIGLDALFGRLKLGKGAAGYILTNILAEGGEEGLTSFANLAADIIIAKDQSEWQKAVDAYMAKGKSEGEAFGQALLDQMAAIGLDTLGGMISGGFVGSTGAAIGNVAESNRYSKLDKDAQQQIVQEGLLTQEGSKAHELAQKYQTKLDKNGKLSGGQLYRLDAKTTEQVTQEDTRKIREAVAQRLTELGEDGNVSALAQIITDLTLGEDVSEQQLRTLRASKYGQRVRNELDPNNVISGDYSSDWAQNIGTRRLAPSIYGRQAAESQTVGNTAQEQIERNWGGRSDSGEPGSGKGSVRLADPKVQVNEEQWQSMRRLSAALGKNIVLYSESATEHGIQNGYLLDEEIHVNTNSSDPFAQVVSHELTHSVETADVYQELSKMILDKMAAEGVDLARLRTQTAQLYANNGVHLKDEAEINREIVADYTAKYLLSDEHSIIEVTRRKPSLGKRILNWLKSILAKLGSSGAQEKMFLERARDLYADALRQSSTGDVGGSRNAEGAEGGSNSVPANSEIEEMKSWMQQQYANGDMTEDEFDTMWDQLAEWEERNNAQEPAEVKHSISPVSENAGAYEADIDMWVAEGMPDGEIFILGSTGDVLQGLGAIESDIYIRGDKVKRILEEHSEISISEIKKVPQILEDPVLILKSRNVGRGMRSNTRLVIFGTVRAQNGQPVLSVLDLRPVENNLVIDDMQKVSSTYTKETDPVGFITASDVVYADKKRTAKLLRTIGFQMPIELQQSGYIGSISYVGQNVNIKGERCSDVIAAGETENADTSNRKYSFAGPKAQTADMDALAEAQRLQADGMSNEGTRLETGWFTGMDGKWRWEIDDSDMRYFSGGDAMVAAVEPDYERYRELMEKMFQHELTVGDVHELQQLDSVWDGKFDHLRERLYNGEATLEDILQHDKLYEAYPELRNVKIRMEPMDSLGGGRYQPDTNTIVLNPNTIEQIEKVLIHEIQHAIQEIEGFTPGTSRGYWLENKNPGEKRNSYDLYRNTAGEIEARDTARRWHLSEKERKIRTPAKANEDTVFVSRYTVSEDAGNMGLFLPEERDAYTYDYLTAQPDMEIVELPDVDTIRDSNRKVDTGKVISEGMKNARSVGTERAGKVYVKNRYTGRELRVDVSSIRHGLNGGMNRLLTNARLGSVVGEVVQNAIPINALQNEAEGVTGTYAMAGYARDGKGREFVAIVTVEQRDGSVSGIDTFDVAHAISGRMKRSKQVDTKSQGVNPSMLASEISIADLLAVVKETYQSILPNDVLSHFGESKNPDGYYYGRAKFSVSGSREAAQSQEEAEGLSLPTVGEDTRTDIRGQLPAKARDYLKRVERKLLNDLGKKLCVPYLARRDYLQEIVQEISEEYLSDGMVSQETLDRLFTKAYEQGIVVDSEFYDQYKDIKDYLRTTAVTIGETDKADIPDFADFRKRSFGTLRIVNKGGLPVNSAYTELQVMATELFPDYLTHPADQLQRMFEVARSIERVEKTLGEYYGEDEAAFRRLARMDFDRAIDDVMGELRTVKRYAEEREADKEKKVPMTPAEAMDTYAQLKNARRSYEKVASKNLLTEHDEAIVGDLLKGKRTLESLDPDEDNVKGITAVYEAKRELEQYVKAIAGYKRILRKDALQTADGYLETANEWKDKPAGILYSRETMSRNVLDIVKDPGVAKQVIRAYFEPVSTAEAEAARFKQRYRDRVRELGISRKVEKGNLVSEAHAVQLLGEAMDNIRVIENARGRLKTRDGKTLTEWKAVVTDLWKESPGLDVQKIQNAVEEFRKLYDELFVRMNEVRVANGYEPVNYRKGYFPHFQPGESDGILAHFGKAMGISTEVVALPTTINGLTHTFKPGIQWFGNAQERLGFNTAYDAIEGFDKYIEGVASVIHQTKNIQNLRALATQIRYRTSDDGIREQVDRVNANEHLTEEEKQVQIAEIYSRGRFTLSNFVVELDEYTNLLANKKSKLDRMVEAWFGRRFYTVAKWWEDRIGANMIAGNLSSALTNFIPLTQAGAQLDGRSMLSGMWDTLKSYKQSDALMSRSDFIINRRGVDPLVKSWVEKASEVAGKPMELIDGFVSESIVRAAYYQNRKQGLSEDEAMHQADLFAAGVMADRSKGAMPTLFQSRNPLIKLFTQFQLEVNNQFSELFKDLPRRFREQGVKTLAMVLLKYFLGAFLYNELYEWLFGRRPALDPVGILIDFAEDIPEAGFGGAVKNLGGDVLGELPFSAGLTLVGIETDGGRIPASSAIMDVTALWDAATNTEWSGEKRLKEAWDELSKPATYVLPPFGGNQASKIWKGLTAYFKGGSYTVDADGNDILQYPVYKDEGADAFWSLVRAALMGKSSLPTAQDWVDGGFNSFSAKQTATYQDMLECGVPDRDAYELIVTLREIEGTKDEPKAMRQREILRQVDISGEGRAIAYYGLVASDSDRELMDKLADAGAAPGDAVDVTMKLRDINSLKGLEKKQAQSDVITESGLTDEEKSAVIEWLYGSELLTEEGHPTQYAKFLCAIETGLQVDGYLELYGSGVDIDSYFELTDSGMSPEDAKELAMTMADLRPEDDEDRVIDLQRWRVCVDFSDNIEDQLTALFSVMRPERFEKVELANGFGVTPEAYVSFYETLAGYDTDGSGSFTQLEYAAAVDSCNLDLEQKAALWQIVTGAKSAKNNPFSVSVGEQVLAEKLKSSEESEDASEDLSFSEEIMRQLMGNG